MAAYENRRNNYHIVGICQFCKKTILEGNLIIINTKPYHRGCYKFNKDKIENQDLRNFDGSTIKEEQI